MQASTCGLDNRNGSCETPSPANHNADPLGRRIYIHEESLTEVARHGRRQALLVFNMAVKNIIIKAAHHAEQDAALLGFDLTAGMSRLSDAITSVWSATTTWTLHRIAFRSNQPRLRAHLQPLLRSDESIFATCFFANYYTFATGKRSADDMFADTNQIASVRQSVAAGSEQYADMTLLNGNCLFMIEEGMPLGDGAANAVANAWKARPRLSNVELNEIRNEVRAAVLIELQQLMNSILDLTDARDVRLGKSLEVAIEGAFTRGLLKVAH